MTRKLTPEDRKAAAAAPLWVNDAIRAVFKGSPDWMMWAALAALHDLRPDRGPADVKWLNVHLWNLPRNDIYFARVCHLLRLHGVGDQWGRE